MISAECWRCPFRVWVSDTGEASRVLRNHHRQEHRLAEVLQHGAHREDDLTAIARAVGILTD